MTNAEEINNAELIADEKGRLDRVFSGEEMSRALTGLISNRDIEKNQQIITDGIIDNSESLRPATIDAYQQIMSENTQGTRNELGDFPLDRQRLNNLDLTARGVLGGAIEGRLINEARDADFDQFTEMAKKAKELTPTYLQNYLILTLHKALKDKQTKIEERYGNRPNKPSGLEKIQDELTKLEDMYNIEETKEAFNKLVDSHLQEMAEEENITSFQTYSDLTDALINRQGEVAASEFKEGSPESNIAYLEHESKGMETKISILKKLAAGEGEYVIERGNSYTELLSQHENMLRNTQERIDKLQQEISQSE